MGLLVDKNAEHLTLKTVEKKLVDIKRADIDENRKNRNSLMPEKLLSDLTAGSSRPFTIRSRRTKCSTVSHRLCKGCIDES